VGVVAGGVVVAGAGGGGGGAAGSVVVVVVVVVVNGGITTLPLESNGNMGLSAIAGTAVISGIEPISNVATRVKISFFEFILHLLMNSMF
jgi:hypothetical protein